MKRRSAVQLIVLGSAAAPPPAPGQQHAGHAAAAPAAAAPARLRFLTAEQNTLVDELAEMIIPADAHSPGAREAKVSEFIDGVLANSDAGVQRAWSGGLAAVDAEAAKRHGKPFLKCTAPQRDSILRAMADGEESPKTELHRFFIMLKRQTLSGYYTSSIGLLKDLQYKGIVPLAAYPPCDHPDHQRPPAAAARARKQ